MLRISFIVTNCFVWWFTPYFPFTPSFSGHCARGTIDLAQPLHGMHLDIDCSQALQQILYRC